jgi:predicted dinucleotide-binding enzyme
MQIGVLGTGNVGQALGTRLAKLGHHVRMGSRTKDNANASKWARKAGKRASHGTFADAAEFGEVLFNCTAGSTSLAALQAVPAAAFEGKILVDVANPLDFSHGLPPTLSVCNTDSLGEQIQRALPNARVVKALNTMNNSVMVHPEQLSDQHDVFVCGDDADAKATVRGILNEFGWPDEQIHDLGGIASARAQEMLLPLWLQVLNELGHPNFNLRVVT